MADVGRPTELNDELFGKLKEAILDFKTLKDFAKENGIKEDTVWYWSCTNYQGLADKVELWKMERKLALADVNIEKILKLDPSDKDFVRPVGDMAKFVKETLDKKNYSKRTEQTGPGGVPLTINVVNYSDKKE